MSDNEKIADLMRQARERRRRYANWWQWPPDPSTIELEIARLLLRYLKIDAIELRKGDDPPDCEVTLKDGSRIGIEVTEIVDQQMVEQHEAARWRRKKGRPPQPTEPDVYEFAEWDAPRLIDAVGQLLKRKDVPGEKLKGGPNSRYIVALHTDEPIINVESAQRALHGVTPYETSSIDEAYLVLSYDPRHKFEFPDGYPVIRVPVRRRS